MLCLLDVDDGELAAACLRAPRLPPSSSEASLIVRTCACLEASLLSVRRIKPCPSLIVMLYFLYSHYNAVFPLSNNIGYGSIAAINLYCLYQAVCPLSGDIACRGLEGHGVCPPFVRDSPGRPLLWFHSGGYV